jgi:hypothetical protein
VFWLQTCSMHCCRNTPAHHHHHRQHRRAWAVVPPLTSTIRPTTASSTTQPATRRTPTLSLRRRQRLWMPAAAAPHRRGRRSSLGASVSHRRGTAARPATVRSRPSLTDLVRRSSSSPRRVRRTSVPLAKMRLLRPTATGGRLPSHDCRRASLRGSPAAAAAGASAHPPLRYARLVRAPSRHPRSRHHRQRAPCNDRRCSLPSITV